MNLKLGASEGVRGQGSVMVSAKSESKRARAPSNIFKIILL